MLLGIRATLLESHTPSYRLTWSTVLKFYSQGLRACQNCQIASAHCWLEILPVCICSNALFLTHLKFAVSFLHYRYLSSTQLVGIGFQLSDIESGEELVLKSLLPLHVKFFLIRLHLELEFGKIWRYQVIQTRGWKAQVWGSRWYVECKRPEGSLNGQCLTNNKQQS